jgi:erythromycin esterase-like protein
MGSFLAERFGKDLLVLGFACHEGRYSAIKQGKGLTDDNAVTPSYPGTLECYFHESGLPRLILDMRKAAAKTADSAWLTRSLDFRSIGALAMDQQFHPTRLVDEYDGLIYFDQTTASKLLRLERK